MSLKSRTVGTMLRLYPRAWRNEYGLELEEILLRPPLTARTVANVLCNGAWQRARMAEPSTLLGLGAMLVVLSELIANVAAPATADRWPTALLQDSHMTLPRVIVAPLAPESNLYVLCLIACGVWTTLRHRDVPSRSMRAAMKMTLIAGIPVMATGVLMLSGVLHLNTLGPGARPLPGLTHGLAYTYYSAAGHSPSRVEIFIAPLFALGTSMIWGWVGGSIGRLFIRRQPRPARL